MAPKQAYLVIPQLSAYSNHATLVNMSREATISTQMREAIAENMKERIYSSITLLALMAALWQHADDHSALGAATSIFGAAIALWLATLIATRMSYRAVHGKSITHRTYIHTLFASAGLLAPAIAPIVLITISGATGLYSLRSALFASMVIGLLSLFLLSFNAGRKIYDSLGRLIIVSALEMSVGIGVILLKLAIGK